MTTPRDGDFSPAQLARMDANVAELTALHAQKHSLDARELELLHELTQLALTAHAATPAARRAAEIPIRTVAAEIGAAFRVSDRTVQRLMDEAHTLFTRFPATVESLAGGRISRAHVRVIVEAAAHITDPQARLDFETTALPVAERESATRLRPFVKLLAERIHPRSLTQRHDAAAQERAVRVVDLPDGMAELIATLPATIAHAAYERLSAMAREVTRAIAAEAKTALGGQAAGDMATTGAHDTAPRGEGTAPKDEDVVLTDAHCRDTRSADQLRADILADLLLAGTPNAHIPTGLGAIRAQVQIVVPVLALLGCTEEPATLAGVGPIDADTARRLTGGAKGWDRVLTHPISGAVLTTDRYRPGKHLTRALQIRDQHCRFPGCRIPVRNCDIDHTTDYAHGGETSDHNLAHLCRRHHTLKHASAWTVVQKAGGILEWTSPTGRVYPDIPTSRVMFQPLTNESSVDLFEAAPF